MLLIQLPLAYYFYTLTRIRRETKTIELIAGENPRVRRGPLVVDENGTVDPRRKLLVQQLLADQGLEEEFFAVTKLTCKKRELTDSLQDAMLELPNLEALSFSRCRFSDKACLPSGRLTRLKQLGIIGGTLSHAMVDSIASQPSLEELGLTGCTLDSPYWSGLGALKSLKKLTISKCEPQIDDWSFLSTMTDLTYLHIDGQNHVGSALPFLPMSLRHFGAWNCDLADVDARSGLPELALEELYFPNTMLVRAALVEILQHCPNAKTVVLTRTKLTKDDAERLVQLFPSIRFQF